jgi:CubicO group peptidase (beta-lactamase class C family)
MTSDRLGALVFRTTLFTALFFALGAPTPRAEDKLLAEAVEFTGTFIYLGAKPPGFVIGAIRNGETVVRGFGEIADGTGKEPDGDTLMRIGSITKVFCGATWRAWWPTARSRSPTRFRIGSGGT